jgi:hypothetical protein
MGRPTTNTWLLLQEIGPILSDHKMSGQPGPVASNVSSTQGIGLLSQ